MTTANGNTYVLYGAAANILGLAVQEIERVKDILTDEIISVTCWWTNCYAKKTAGWLGPLIRGREKRQTDRLDDS